MRILIIYRFPHHHVMMKRMASLLSKEGIKADVLCLKTFEFTNNSKLWWGKIGSFLFSGIPKIRPYKLRNTLLKLFRNHILPLMVSQYDKIDFQSYYIDLYDLMSHCVKFHIPYDITLWGSDILRVDNNMLNQMKYGFDHCEYIKGIDKLLDKVSDNYSHAYDNKLLVAYFGDAMCDVIDNIDSSTVNKLNLKLFERIKGRIIVTCGYNAMPAQQHEMIIEALNQLSSEQKQQIYLVFPMTYEKSEKYLDKINYLLEKTGIDYLILDKFLSEEELATVRLKTDIVVNTQTTDALAAALVQHLYCGNVLIVGEWLEYKPFDSRDIYYIKTCPENLAKTISEVIDDFPKFKTQTSGNHDKLLDIASWNSTIYQWIKAYK